MVVVEEYEDGGCRTETDVADLNGGCGEDEYGVWRGRRWLCERRAGGGADGGRVVVVEIQREKEGTVVAVLVQREERREEIINKITPYSHLKYQLCH